MAPVSAPAKVLVTGANGYVAVWVTKALLESGYSVRGTVRSASKGEHLKKLFASYGDKLELVVVADITKEGAFDEAVKGVDLVEHTASPFHLKSKTPDEVIVPALKGTVSVLESIKKYGTSVKRVIVTASVASILQVPLLPNVFDESSWNEPSIKNCNELGDNANPMDMYCASKTLAEKAAWDFVEKNKGSISWDLVVLNPPYVYGATIQEVADTSSINTSMQEFYDRVILGDMDDDGLATNGNACVDIRDLAKAHVLAAQKAEAGGERIIISSAPYYWQEFVDISNAVAPTLKLHKGNPGSTKGKPYPCDFKNSKSARILGLKYIPKEDMIRDVLIDFKQRGWAQQI